MRFVQILATSLALLSCAFAQTPTITVCSTAVVSTITSPASLCTVTACADCDNSNSVFSQISRDSSSRSMILSAYSSRVSQQPVTTYSVSELASSYARVIQNRVAFVGDQSCLSANEVYALLDSLISTIDQVDQLLQQGIAKTRALLGAATYDSLARSWIGSLRNRVELSQYYLWLSQGCVNWDQVITVNNKLDSLDANYPTWTKVTGYPPLPRLKPPCRDVLTWDNVPSTCPPPLCRASEITTSACVFCNLPEASLSTLKSGIASATSALSTVLSYATEVPFTGDNMFTLIVNAERGGSDAFVAIPQDGGCYSPEQSHEYLTTITGYFKSLTRMLELYPTVESAVGGSIFFYNNFGARSAGMMQIFTNALQIRFNNVYSCYDCNEVFAYNAAIRDFFSKYAVYLAYTNPFYKPIDMPQLVADCAPCAVSSASSFLASSELSDVSTGPTPVSAVSVSEVSSLEASISAVSVDPSQISPNPSVVSTEASSASMEPTDASSNILVMSSDASSEVSGVSSAEPTSASSDALSLPSAEPTDASSDATDLTSAEPTEASNVSIVSSVESTDASSAIPGVSSADPTTSLDISAASSAASTEAASVVSSVEPTEASSDVSDAVSSVPTDASSGVSSGEPTASSDVSAVVSAEVSSDVSQVPSAEPTGAFSSVSSTELTDGFAVSSAAPTASSDISDFSSASSAYSSAGSTQATDSFAVTTAYPTEQSAVSLTPTEVSDQSAVESRLSASDNSFESTALDLSSVVSPEITDASVPSSAEPTRPASGGSSAETTEASYASSAPQEATSATPTDVFSWSTQASSGSGRSNGPTQASEVHVSAESAEASQLSFTGLTEASALSSRLTEVSSVSLQTDTSAAPSGAPESTEPPVAGGSSLTASDAPSPSVKPTQFSESSEPTGNSVASSAWPASGISSYRSALIGSTEYPSSGESSGLSTASLTEPTETSTASSVAEPSEVSTFSRLAGSSETSFSVSSGAVSTVEADVDTSLETSPILPTVISTPSTVESVSARRSSPFGYFNTTSTLGSRSDNTDRISTQDTAVTSTSSDGTSDHQNTTPTEGTLPDTIPSTRDSSTRSTTANGHIDKSTAADTVTIPCHGCPDSTRPAVIGPSAIPSEPLITPTVGKASTVITKQSITTSVTELPVAVTDLTTTTDTDLPEATTTLKLSITGAGLVTTAKRSISAQTTASNTANLLGTALPTTEQSPFPTECPECDEGDITESTAISSITRSGHRPSPTAIGSSSSMGSPGGSLTVSEISSESDQTSVIPNSGRKKTFSLLLLLPALLGL